MIGFALLTAVVCAVTVYLANRVTAATSDERAMARAQTCSTEGAGNRDCIEEVAGAAVGSPWKVYKRQDVKLKVSSGGKQTTLTFPNGVAPAFLRIQDGDFVELATWHGDIVSVTAQGDTENTPSAPSEQHRSRLTAAFFGASFTVVLAGLTLLSLVMTEPFFADSRRRPPGLIAASIVIYGGFATALGAIAVMTGGTITAAIVTAVIILVVGVAGAAGAWLSHRLRFDREMEDALRPAPGK